MQNHFKRWLIIGISSILLSGCGVLFATGDWFNADYPVTPPFLIELMGRKSKSLLLFKNRWTTIY